MAFASDYALALEQLLPQGAAWTVSGTPLGDLLSALAQELARVDARATVLRGESDPGEASELLVDWERVLGLPDPCLTVAQSTAQRQLAARTQFTLAGGQSADWFVALAARLGYTVTVEDFSSALEATAAGITFTGSGWAYTWRMNVGVDTPVTVFRAGSGRAGDALVEWGDELLECVVKRHCPAHTIVLFAYA